MIESFVAQLEDWHRIATRHDRTPVVFLSACARSAIVTFLL